MDDLRARAIDFYRREFGTAARWVAVAPGRVNLIGEHVDYNDGVVLPMAIERGTAVAAGLSGGRDKRHRVVSEGLRSNADFEIPDVVASASRMKGVWWSHVAGVTSLFDERWTLSNSLNFAVVSNLPMGSGLSSSAALSVATALVVDASVQSQLSRLDLARICQSAEHRFAGVPCGIMDPLCIAASEANACLSIDCRNETFRPVPWNDPAVTVMIADTGVRRSLADGRYAERRSQCAVARQALGAASLRDVTPTQIEAARDQMEETVWRRARHVASEINRVSAAEEAVQHQDWVGFGRLMVESHESLRTDFEVSCRELDWMVELALALPGVWGSRMTGAGFGGCTVSLVQANSAQDIARELRDQYWSRSGRDASVFCTRPTAGARVDSLELRP